MTDTSVDLLGKDCDDLQETVAVADGAVTGTLKYVTGYTGWSGDPDEQEGNYLALKADFPDGATTTVEIVNGMFGPATLDEDKNMVLRIADKDVQKVKLVSTGADGTVITKVYSLKSLKLEPKAD